MSTSGERAEESVQKEDTGAVLQMAPLEVLVATRVADDSSVHRYM